VSDLEGILPAVLTPLDEAGRFTEPAFARLLEHVFSAGSSGIYVGGYSGEGFHLPTATRLALADAALRLTPKDKAVVVHVGSATLADTLRLARHAAEGGARAIASVPPAGADTPADERAWFEQLTREVSVPVLVYYLPAVCGVRSLAALRALCTTPGVSGLKYSDTDVYAISTLAGDGNLVFVGCDEILAAGLYGGASGGVGGFYNLVPEAFVRIHRLTRAGAWEEARAVQAAVNELIAVIVEYPLVPAFKACMTWLGIDCGPPAPPRQGLSPEQQTRLREALGRTKLGHQFATSASVPSP
jgi:N-acetylneuraminate lyase